MASTKIKATTIDNIEETSTVDENTNILIQDPTDKTKTRRTSLKTLTSVFGSGSNSYESTSTQGNYSDTLNEQTANDFNTREYASSKQLTSFTESSELGLPGVCYLSETYTAKCEKEEIYLHFDASLSSTQDMSSYPDAYMTVQIKMPNDNTVDENTYIWQTICRKPIWDMGKLGVKSIDFHFCIEAGMKIRAFIYGGERNTSSIFSLINAGTALNLTIVSKEPSPVYDSTSYLQYNGQCLTFQKSTIGTDYAVEVYALGTSSTDKNKMNIKISSNGEFQDTGYVADYTKDKDIGQVFLGKFYFGKEDVITLGLSRKFDSTKPMYILAKYHTEEKSLSTDITTIESNTIKSNKSLMVESRGDFAFSGVTLQNSTEMTDATFLYPEGAMETVHLKVSPEKICGQQADSANVHRIQYFEDNYISYRKSEANATVNTSLNAIRFNSSYISVPNYGFKYCTALSSVDFGSESNTKSIGTQAFYGCKNLKDVSFSQKTETIGASAFLSCISLERVFLPIGVKTVLGTAFAKCTALKEFYLPYDFTSIASTVLSGVSNFATNGGQLYVVIPEDTTGYSDAWNKLTQNISNLDTLYNVAGFKKDGNVTLICVKPSGEKFVYEDTGHKYNLGIVIDSAKSSGSPKTIQVS